MPRLVGWGGTRMHAPSRDALPCTQGHPKGHRKPRSTSSPPATLVRPDMHGATVPRRSIPIGAPFALPIRPPDDELVELVVRPLLAFEWAPAARVCSDVA